jgi:hypothetical protein
MLRIAQTSDSGARSKQVGSSSLPTLPAVDISQTSITTMLWWLSSPIGDDRGIAPNMDSTSRELDEKLRIAAVSHWLHELLKLD